MMKKPNRSIHASAFILPLLLLASCHFHPTESGDWKDIVLTDVPCAKIEAAIWQFMDFDRMVIQEQDGVLYGTGSFCTIGIKTSPMGTDACRLSLTSICSDPPEEIVIQHVLASVYRN